MKDFVVVDKEFMERATNAILEVETLMMAHDNLQRELSDIKRLMGKDKHALIKSNIALNKKVQELEKENEKLRKLEKYDSLEINNLSQQNKRYREAILNILLKEHENMEGYETEIFAIAKNALNLSDEELIKLLEGEE